MRVVRIALSVILIFPNLLPAAPPRLRTSRISTASVSATTILQQALIALVGNTPLTDITLSGTAHRIAGSEDETGTLSYRALSTGAARFDFSYPSGPWEEVHAAISAGPLGTWSGPDGVSHPIALHNLANRSDIFPAFTLAPLTSSANLVVTLVGLETKNGQSVYHVSVSQQFPKMKPKSAALAAHLTQTDLFLDVSTLLPVALDFNTHPDDNSSLDIPIELLFSDYHSISGVQVPFHVEKFLNNGLVLDLEFQSASINTGLSASLFNVQ
jgi:hypothetical protein